MKSLATVPSLVLLHVPIPEYPIAAFTLAGRDVIAKTVSFELLKRENVSKKRAAYQKVTTQCITYFED